MSAASSGLVVDFTSLDYESVQSDLTSFAQRRFSEKWTNYNDSDPGVFLLQLMAYATDLLAFNANAQVLEGIVTTVVRERNFRRLSVGYDYQMNGPSQASSVQRCTLDPLGVYPFTLSKHVQFASTDGSVIFQPVEDVAVAAYPLSGYVDVDCIEGIESYQEVLGTTTGVHNETFILGNDPLVDNSLTVTVGADTYLKTNAFVEAAATDKVYTITVDEDGTTTLTFGDGVNGVVPPKGDTVTATYKYSAGDAGNLPYNEITSLFGTSDGSLFPAQVTATTNVDPSTGGGPKQTLLNAKLNLPASLAANDRGVTLDDFAALVLDNVSSIVKATALNGKFESGSSPVLIYCVPAGGGDITAVQRNQIAVSLKGKKLAGKRVRGYTAKYASMSVSLDLFVLDGASSVLTAERVRNLLLDRYSIDSVDFGVTLSLQEAYRLLKPESEAGGVGGVERVLFKRFTISPYYGRHIVSPTTGNGEVLGISINENSAQRREWLIRVIGPNAPTVMVNRFEVYQRILGTVTNVTDTVVEDEQGSFEPNTLTTWDLHPNPEISTTSFVITGNTQKTITCSGGGLLVEIEPDDSYVVEKLETMIGKILRTRVVGVMTAVTNITVASSASFEVGDTVRVYDGTTDERRTVTVIPDGTHLTLSAAVSCANNASVDFVWVSNDETVQFSVVDAADLDSPPTYPSAFVIGDELYVDVYGKSDDLVLRGEVFPTLDSAELVINTIGGV